MIYPPRASSNQAQLGQLVTHPTRATRDKQSPKDLPPWVNGLNFSFHFEPSHIGSNKVTPYTHGQDACTTSKGCSNQSRMGQPLAFSGQSGQKLVLYLDCGRYNHWSTWESNHPMDFSMNRNPRGNMILYWLNQPDFHPTRVQEHFL